MSADKVPPCVDISNHPRRGKVEVFSHSTLVIDGKPMGGWIPTDYVVDIPARTSLRRLEMDWQSRGEVEVRIVIMQELR